MNVRVRFAPSPTGSLHLGSALTALINVLFARSQDGTILLRVDDTDADRSRTELEAGILADLEWLGLGWDEGPVHQSERFDRYRDAATRATDTFIRDGAVYLRGEGIAPFVILRSDGRATYHWASSVDDLDFGVTHVIRGNDHLSNMQLHVAAARALGAEPPEFIHHAVVLGESGKLSKREGAASIAELRSEGYPAEAVVNQLGLVASSGPGEVLSLEQLIERFRPERIARGEVRLDPARLRSLSATYISALPPERLAAQALPWCPPGTPAGLVRDMAPALRGAHTLAEVGDLVASVVAAPEPRPLPRLAEIREGYTDRLDETAARAMVDELRRREVPLREVRLTLTGLPRGPELWSVLVALPRSEVLRRARAGGASGMTQA
jgi:glutamyl/glutaminyl-tRNA synthetase